MTLDEFDALMTGPGWALFESAVPKALIDRMLNHIHGAYSTCRQVQLRNGVGDATEHTVHHLPALNQQAWFDYLETMAVAPYIERFFSGPYILNSMGGNLNPPGTNNYAGAIHRDVRSYSNDRLMLNTLVCLDPFLRSNGATWLMPGSHRFPEKPTEEKFQALAVQVEAPAGSVIVWDSRLWHRAGVNKSQGWRRIVTPIFTRPWFKPGFDYPRALGAAVMAGMSPTLRQVLGQNARVPANLNEWYQPVENRAYMASQG